MIENILIVSAMNFELENLFFEFEKRKLKKMQIDVFWGNKSKKHFIYVFKDESLNKQFFIFSTGIGKKNSINNLKNFLNFYEKSLNSNNQILFSEIYLVGLAGGITSDLKVGDIIEPKNIFYNDEKIILDLEINSNKNLLTVDDPMDFDQKKNISEKEVKNVDIVDMETFFWVKEIKYFFESRNFLNPLENIKIVRAVSDDFYFCFPKILKDKNIAKEVFNVISNRKRLGIKIFFKSLNYFNYNFFETIRDIKKVLKMKKNFNLARKKLTEFLINEALNK